MPISMLLDATNCRAHDDLGNPSTGLAPSGPWRTSLTDFGLVILHPSKASVEAYAAREILNGVCATWVCKRRSSCSSSNTSSRNKSRRVLKSVVNQHKPRAFNNS